ncbi:MAG: hypothetical protein CMG55_04945 [Candidatus Marinimicrobia bacterium]|nr:hypothetical protein [Candidatus Neomarinimicrobiota bacterium]|tara:strand:+ start:724 stop:1143 length:420 start_codon:yes stop_codon:yes gene_type:complete
MHNFHTHITKLLFVFFLIQPHLLYSQQNNIIIKDNWDQTTDKLAHSTTSFGIYYTLRYFEFSRFESLLTATVIGLSYEIYQINDPREKDSDFKGISIQDMGYNSLGILIAYGLDQIITATKSNFKQTSNKRNRQKDLNS